MITRLAETSRCLYASRAEVEEEHRLLESRVKTRTAELAEANDKLVREIDARRRAEDSLRQALAQRDALLGNSQVGLATERGGIIEDINPRGAAILGYDREELLGRSIGTLFPDKASFEIARQEASAQLATQEPIRLEGRLLRRDGTQVWARMHGKRVVDQDAESGTGRIVVWAFDDISREKEQQDRLETAKRQAEDASKAKGSFLAVMAKAASSRLRQPETSGARAAEKSTWRKFTIRVVATMPSPEAPAAKSPTATSWADPA